MTTMLKDFEEKDETRALALFSFTISIGIISKLTALGVLSHADSAHTLEGVLGALERYSDAQDRGVQGARVLVDVAARILSHAADSA